MKRAAMKRNERKLKTIHMEDHLKAKEGKETGATPTRSINQNPSVNPWQFGKPNVGARAQTWCRIPKGPTLLERIKSRRIEKKAKVPINKASRGAEGNSSGTAGCTVLPGEGR